MRLDKKSEPQHFYGFIEMEERIYFIVLLYEGWKFKLVVVSGFVSSRFFAIFT